MVDAPAPPATQTKGPKRGLGSKNKTVDKFTEKKNREGQAAIKERIKRDLAKDHVYLMSDAEQEAFLRQFTVGEETNRRPLEVTVSLNAVEDLAAATVGYLSSQKVEVKDSDVGLLSNVITLQAKAKVSKARSETPVASQPINDPYVEKTTRHLSQTLKSVEIYIDQLGLVENQKQLLIPKVVAPPPVTIPAGKAITDIKRGPETLCVPPQFIQNPFSCPQEHMAWIDVNRFISIDDVVVNYTDFMYRVARKMKSATTVIEFTNTKGTMAQLVGSKTKEYRGLPYLDVWCTRDVPVQILTLGGGFRFGRDSLDPIHSEAISLVERTMDPTAFLLKLQTLNRGSPG